MTKGLLKTILAKETHSDGCILVNEGGDISFLGIVLLAPCIETSAYSFTSFNAKFSREKMGKGSKDSEVYSKSLNF